MMASPVLLAVAAELSDMAKSSLPDLRDGETVQNEWLRDGIYCRDTVFEGQHYRAVYDFRQRKSHYSCGESEGMDLLK